MIVKPQKRPRKAAALSGPFSYSNIFSLFKGQIKTKPLPRTFSRGMGPTVSSRLSMLWFRLSPMTNTAVSYTHLSYYAQHTVTTYCNHEVSPQYMNGLLRGPGHHCFVAVAEDGSIAGYVHLTPVFSILGKKYEVAIYLMPQHTDVYKRQPPRSLSGPFSPEG